MQTKLVPLALFTVLAAGCQRETRSDAMNTGVSDPNRPATASDEESEEEIPLDQVPALVKQAALAAVPGLALEEAELEMEHGSPIYCLEGTADGEAVEVEVAPDGSVIEIERGDDDEDEYGGDDEDDDDDHGEDDD